MPACSNLEIVIVRVRYQKPGGTDIALPCSKTNSSRDPAQCRRYSPTIRNCVSLILPQQWESTRTKCEAMMYQIARRGGCKTSSYNFKTRIGCGRMTEIRSPTNLRLREGGLVIRSYHQAFRRPTSLRLPVSLKLQAISVRETLCAFS